MADLVLNRAGLASVEHVNSHQSTFVVKKNLEIVFFDITLGIFSCLHPLCCIGFTGTSISRASLRLLLLSASLFSLMSSVKNNIGRGLNIALVNGESGGH